LTRFSPRLAWAAAALLVVALVPIAYGRYAPRADECGDPAALLDARAIDPITEATDQGPRGTDVERGRMLGTVKPRRALESGMVVAIQRAYGLPNRLLSPATALPGRREPDDVQLESLETAFGAIPVHYAYERRGRYTRLTAYAMAYRGEPIVSPLRTRLAGAPAALLSGRWPVTVFAAGVRTHSRDLAINRERIDVWLRDAWVRYRTVCTAESPANTSDSRPL